jgi:hypothetical protein
MCFIIKNVIKNDVHSSFDKDVSLQVLDELEKSVFDLSDSSDEYER